MYGISRNIRKESTFVLNMKGFTGKRDNDKKTSYIFSSFVVIVEG